MDIWLKLVSHFVPTCFSTGGHCETDTEVVTHSIPPSAWNIPKPSRIYILTSALSKTNYVKAPDSMVDCGLLITQSK